MHFVLPFGSVLNGGARRCLWDGEALRTRNDSELFPPAWLLAQLPRDTPLDGELFIARGCWGETMSVVRRSTPDERWRRVTYQVFDAPGAKASPSANACTRDTQPTSDINAAPG
jgi:hypothetical protein